MYLLKLPQIFLVLCRLLLIITCKQNFKGNAVEEVSDIKDFKKILRTKTNVLSLFVSNQKQAGPFMKVFRDAADIIKGQGTMLQVDCNGEGKKLCKKLKVNPGIYSLRHYKDGEFNKEYDRKETVQSIVNFMKDPTGDLPWEEEPSAVNVTHVPDPQSLEKLLSKEHRPVMVMFYAPWCGFCKRLKPDYAAAATEVKDFAVMAAIDVNRPENSAIRVKHNITGFPTLLYFKDGELKFAYDGENNKEKLVEFMKNPKKRAVKERDQDEDDDWKEESSAIKFLNGSNFEEFIANQSSVLVMFYAPWCGHCKRLKPEYEKAAAKVKELKLSGVMAAVDATKETGLASKYKVTGYPSVKYFKNGEYAFDVHGRDAKKLIDFMKNPKKSRSLPQQDIPWSEEMTEVVHLNNENIKQELRKKRHALVMFYAPCNSSVETKWQF